MPDSPAFFISLGNPERPWLHFVIEGMRLWQKPLNHCHSVEEVKLGGTHAQPLES